MAVTHARRVGEIEGFDSIDVEYEPIETTREDDGFRSYIPSPFMDLKANRGAIEFRVKNWRRDQAQQLIQGLRRLIDDAEGRPPAPAPLLNVVTWRSHWSAFVSREYSAMPTMHLFDGVYASKKRHGKKADYVLCGREMGEHQTLMLVRHASKFAKFCSVCDRIGARKEAEAAA